MARTRRSQPRRPVTCSAAGKRPGAGSGMTQAAAPSTSARPARSTAARANGSITFARANASASGYEGTNEIQRVAIARAMA